VALLAIARAFALGPRPKRSVLLVWHSGEERGRWGSLYFADHATVPSIASSRNSTST
jgi:Zn-dependent M28 family amino/carboxypeptidase